MTLSSSLQQTLNNKIGCGLQQDVGLSQASPGLTLAGVIAWNNSL